jgi:hypothetical protein
MSTTPRTDAQTCTLDGSAYGAYWVPATLAAELETELAQAWDTLDLMRDEFQRIEAMTVSGEIGGICARAKQKITQRVPVIAQRDEAQRELAAARQELAQARTADELIADLEARGFRWLLSRRGQFMNCSVWKANDHLFSWTSIATEPLATMLERAMSQVDWSKYPVKEGK